MRLLEVIQRSTSFLESRGVESPRLQVELLLAHALRVPRLQLYLQFERVLDEPLLDAVRQAVLRRAQRIPLQHILGSTSFCGLEIEVNLDVLIPRPETEILAELAWTWLAGQPPLTQRAHQALDWGTGSGCLAIAIASHHPTARFHAVDLSPASLEVARRNASRLGVADRIAFVLSDGVDALPDELRFHLVVANPPYIPSDDIRTLQPEVRDHDPQLALDGGADGLDSYRRIAVTLPPRLESSGTLMLEFGDDQASAISDILTGAGWSVSRIVRDLSGRERFLIAEFHRS